MNVQVLDTYLCTVCHIHIQTQVVYLYTSIEKELIIMIYKNASRYKLLTQIKNITAPNQPDNLLKAHSPRKPGT